MAEQGLDGQTKRQEGKTQSVDVGTCGLGRVQGCCLDVQGWDQESQGTDGAEVGKESKEQERIL